MIKITSNNKTHFELVQEALTNHGFKFELEHKKKYRWFGQTVYTITVDFAPSLTFLEFLLSRALETEDYHNAYGIKNMIDKLKHI